MSGLQLPSIIQSDSAHIGARPALIGIASHNFRIYLAASRGRRETNETRIARSASESASFASAFHSAQRAAITRIGGLGRTSRPGPSLSTSVSMVSMTRSGDA